MPEVANLILTGARTIRMLTEKGLSGVSSEIAARKPTFKDGGSSTVVDCCHAVFHLGHLAVYPAMLVERLGFDASSIKVSEEWKTQFQQGAICHDDPRNEIYPSLAVVSEKFFKVMDFTFEKVALVPDKEFFQPITDENLKGMFPTVGAMANFLLNDHVAYHAGQMSTWRRCMGLPSLGI